MPNVLMLQSAINSRFSAVSPPKPSTAFDRSLMAANDGYD
jgi:hypothetical protein